MKPNEPDDLVLRYIPPKAKARAILTVGEDNHTPTTETIAKCALEVRDIARSDDWADVVTQIRRRVSRGTRNDENVRAERAQKLQRTIYLWAADDAIDALAEYVADLKKTLKGQAKSNTHLLTFEESDDSCTAREKQLIKYASALRFLSCARKMLNQESSTRPASWRSCGQSPPWR